MHCLCNQVGGAVHGLLGDGTDKVSVHVSGDRNARVAEQLAHYCEVSARFSVGDAAKKNNGPGFASGQWSLVLAGAIGGPLEGPSTHQSSTW
jgi:hypothetical protein